MLPACRTVSDLYPELFINLKNRLEKVILWSR
jgi:hypothetical protein